MVSEPGVHCQRIKLNTFVIDTLDANCEYLRSKKDKIKTDIKKIACQKQTDR